MDTINKIQTIFTHIQSFNEEPMPKPGISESEIAGYFDSIGLAPTANLVQLYGWHNGIDNLDAFLSFLSVIDAIESYKGNKSLKKDIPDFEWKESWFTVLDMNGDVQICLDLETNELYSVDVECDLVQKIADNYDAYLDAILSLFQSGKYGFDEEACCIEVESDVWNKLREDYNIKNAWDL